MLPIDDRQQVIYHYEIGPSKFLSDVGYPLKSVYQHQELILEALRRKFLFSDEALLHQINLRYGALHYHCRQLYEQFGIIKLEVIKSNPEKVNLSWLNKEILNNATTLNFVKGGLLN
jgi:hypothetical protein